MRVRGGCARSIGEIGGPITYVQVKYKGRLLSPEQMNSRASKAPKGKGGKLMLSQYRSLVVGVCTSAWLICVSGDVM